MEDLDEVFHDTLIEIFTTKMGVTVSSDDLEHAIIDGQKGYIKCTSTQIEDKDVLLTFSFLV